MMMYDEGTDEQEKKPENPPEEGYLAKAAKFFKHLTGEPEPESPAAKMQEGAKIVQGVVKKNPPPKGTLLIGSSRATIAENVRSLKAQGYSEEEAIRRAQAKANDKK